MGVSKLSPLAASVTSSAAAPRAGRRDVHRGGRWRIAAAALWLVALGAAAAIGRADAGPGRGEPAAAEAPKPRPAAPAAGAAPTAPLPTAPGAPPPAAPAAPSAAPTGVAECAGVPDDMRCVPAGEFVRGSNEREPDQRPEEKLWISTFFLDTYEVTNQQWRACVAAGQCRKHAGPAYKGFSAPRQPIVGVSWFDARDFCAWRGKRLPTEAEWEKAARGPDGAEHSWGDERATCKRAILEERGAKGCGLGEPSKGATAPVGSRPAGAYGLFDMAGNSWEWVQDWYTKSYAACGEACRGQDPKGPCGGADECPGYRHRGVRGGSWWWPAKYASGSWRRAHLPGNKPFHHFGFRCARSPPPAGST
jgi:formylglycine-generating enzyme required for sulfatase activity